MSVFYKIWEQYYGFWKKRGWRNGEFQAVWKRSTLYLPSKLLYPVLNDRKVRCQMDMESEGELIHFL